MPRKWRRAWKGGSAAPPRPAGDGVYATVDEAVKAAARAQKRIAGMSLEERGRIIAIIRRMCAENAAEWARIELDETRLGRLDHKIEKLKNIRYVPGVEAMRSEVRTDASGLCLIERAPWGVIGMILPATHSVPTMASNAINVIASGNTAVFSPHPAAAKVAALALAALNREIERETGVTDAITTMADASIRVGRGSVPSRRRRAAVRDRRPGGGPGGGQIRQARDCGRAGQSAGGGG